MSDYRVPSRSNYQSYGRMDGFSRPMGRVAPRHQLNDAATQQPAKKAVPITESIVSNAQQQPMQKPEAVSANSSMPKQPAHQKPFVDEQTLRSITLDDKAELTTNSNRNSMFKKVEVLPTKEHVKKAKRVFGKVKPPKMYKFRNWHEFRLFAAGATLSMSLIGFGFYLGVTKPTLGYNGVSGDVEAYDQRMTVYGPPVDVGVNADQVDTEAHTYTILPDMPSRIIIDSIGVNAQVTPLGLARTGALAVPAKLDQVGWYKPSAKPGTKGTIVMDGHFGQNNNPVFENLHKVTKGDVIAIQNGMGESFIYEIERREVYDRLSTPMAELVATDGKERLNIISCYGKWLEEEKTFEQRQIVYAKRIQ